MATIFLFGERLNIFKKLSEGFNGVELYLEDDNNLGALRVTLHTMLNPNEAIVFQYRISASNSVERAENGMLVGVADLDAEADRLRQMIWRDS